MQITNRNKIVLSTLALCATAGVAGTLAPVAAAPNDPVKPTVPPTPSGKKITAPKALTEEEKILHVLNRLGYGARPGDVEKVKAMGLQKYIALQLTPEQIDDSALDKQLAAYTQLQLSDEKINEIYHDFVTAARGAKNQNKQKKKQAHAEISAMPADGTAMAEAAPKKKKKPAMDKEERQAMREAKEEQANAAVPVAQAHAQFMAAKMLRAIDSDRQLQEVLVDFWSNHFNIDMRRSPCGILKIADDRDVIRPHVLGKFRDLVGASAKSPAMLVYLDNYLSTADPADMAAAATPGKKGKAKAKAKKAAGGLNENYGRELMELHTLGVDGGYTQQDVREVARCFTGWSVAMGDAKKPAKGRYQDAGTFHFFPALHDNGQKTVLGHVIPAGGGEQDAEKVLDILASHPATMRHISTQLCERLVSDTPPPSLIDKCVATWKRTGGDLREVTRTIVTSPEFFSAAAYRGKIKSPFEYAVSSVRALGGDYQSAAALDTAPPMKEANYLIKPPKGGGYLDMSEKTLIGQVGTMGQPLFQYQAPTGYPEDSRKWVSAGALISRLNFSLALTNGKLADVTRFKFSSDMLAVKDANQLLDLLSKQVLHSPIAPATRATLLKELGPTVTTASTASDSNTANRIAALLLGSPEFQRH